MTKIISLLERIGRDAQLRYAPSCDISRAMAESDIGASARAAILSGDRSALEALLGAETGLCCLVEVPEDEGPSEGLRPHRSVVRGARETALVN